MFGQGAGSVSKQEAEAQEGLVAKGGDGITLKQKPNGNKEFLPITRIIAEIPEARLFQQLDLD